MAAMPPARNTAVPEEHHPWWMLIGPGIATITGLFMLSAVYAPGRGSLMIVELGLSNQDLLLKGIVAYLVAGAVAFPLGFSLGGRSPTALILSALGIMLIGVVLTAFAAGGAMLLAGRVISGFGAGVAVGVTVATVRRMSGSRAAAGAVVAVLGVLSTAAAPFVDQAISETTSFRVAQLATVLFLFVALFASVVSAIARAVTAGRPAQPRAYGMPYAPQQYPGQVYQAPQYRPQQPPAPPYPAPPYPPPGPGR